MFPCPIFVQCTPVFKMDMILLSWNLTSMEVCNAFRGFPLFNLFPALNQRLGLKFLIVATALPQS